MSRPLLTLLAAKARLGALVAGTALATAAVVGGGGTVALQSVATVSPEPAPVAEKGQNADKRSQGAEKRGLAKLAKLQRDNQAPAAPFTCDPTKTHGQNVAAYVHSLPKGPGRGALVSQAAKSDCGKQGEGAEEEAEDGTTKAGKPDKPDKPDKAGKPEGVGKPVKPARPDKVAVPDPAAREKDTEPAKSGSAKPHGTPKP